MNSYHWSECSNINQIVQRTHDNWQGTNHNWAECVQNLTSLQTKHFKHLSYKVMEPLIHVCPFNIFWTLLVLFVSIDNSIAEAFFFFLRDGNQNKVQGNLIPKSEARTSQQLPGVLFQLQQLFLSTQRFPQEHKSILQRSKFNLIYILNLLV